MTETKYGIKMSFVGGHTYDKKYNTKEERDEFIDLLNSYNWNKGRVITTKCGINLKHLCCYNIYEIEVEV